MVEVKTYSINRHEYIDKCVKGKTCHGLALDSKFQ